jgi:hypothetical protein
MNSHLIANRRPGRTATMIHIEGVGCAALAQAKYTRSLGDERELSEVLRNAIALATAFKQMHVCRKCRAAARQILAIAAKRAATLPAPQPEVKTVPLVIEMADTVRYSSIHHKGCRSVEDPMDLGRAANASEIPGLVMNATGWDDYEAHDLYLCACAKTRLK